jgi:hypothetical protein
MVTVGDERFMIDPYTIASPFLSVFVQASDLIWLLGVHHPGYGPLPVMPLSPRKDEVQPQPCLL